ncbi:wolframin [Denticeps clupeoides]|uniref:Wolframin n=1 Tax=Denticeps clupeoides TaxID=299321 RepID=A0AAY4AXR5_9TELE|nr:wolframin-like [Denticeps clupeoides]
MDVRHPIPSAVKAETGPHDHVDADPTLNVSQPTASPPAPAAKSHRQSSLTGDTSSSAVMAATSPGRTDASSKPPQNLEAAYSSPAPPIMSSSTSTTPASTPTINTESQSTNTTPTNTLTSDSSSTTGMAGQGAPPRTRSFAALARRVIIEEKIKKEAESFDCQEEDEDLAAIPIEVLENMARSGDAKAQSCLGKYYLRCAEEKDADANNEIAVQWLLKAAKLGRKDAAKMLQRCWIQRKGITPETEAEVRKLSMESKFERTVRRAAMMMYQKLNPDGKKKLAMSEMLENVNQVNAVSGVPASPGLKPPSVEKQRKVLESMVGCGCDSYVDLDHFVEITKKYAQGIVPIAALEIREEKAQGTSASSTVPSDKDKLHGVPPTSKRRHSWGQTGMILASKRHSGAMKRAMDIKAHFLDLQYPLHIIIEMKERLVDWASRAGVQWLSTIIPTHHVNALIFFFIISNLTIDLFAFVIPLLIFYLSFIAMGICTLRVFHRSKGWENFSTLTTLLTRFEPSLDVEQAENNFGWNNLEQYLYFIISVFFVIFTFPVADKRWIPCSELSTVAIFFTILSYMSLSPTAAAYAQWALITEVASSVFLLANRLPDRMVMLRMLGKTFSAVPLGNWVVLKLSLPCLLYMYLFYLFFRMARVRGFRGTYCVLIPYLVCFMWWEFSVVLLQHSTCVGLLRTCVAYFLLLFALPVLAVGLMVMMLIQMAKWFLELELTKMLVTLAVCAVPVTLRLWTRFSLSILDVLRSITHRGPVKLILICICTVILLCSVYVYNTEDLKVYNSTMTWSQYGQVCGPPAWQRRGMAQAQIFCSHLEGHRVTWTGRFRHVRVAETENGAQSVINLLPVFMGDWMRCLYGEAYPKCEPHNVTAPGVNVSDGNPRPTEASPDLLLRQREEEELCHLKALAKHQCHVKRFDSYRFEVTVGMPLDLSPSPVDDPAYDVVLRASHEFRQVLLNIDSGSMVEFSTKLEGRLGTKLPAFELKAIHCLDCKSSLLPEGRQVKIERNWRQTTQRAMKFAFDFFFSPFLSASIRV